MSQGANFDLTGKVALITGAGRGIGRGMAQALAAQGCAIAIQDIDEAIAQKAVEGIVADGGRAIALGGDIGDLARTPQLVQQTVSKLGGLHILINNAAIQQWTDWAALPVEQLEQQHRANLLAPLLLCQQVAPIFRGQKFGRIVNIGSIQQLRGNRIGLAYSMTKAALHHMTRMLARELAGDGITVNMIAPGYFDTWRNRNDFPSEQVKREKGEKIIPAGRVGEPEDCAGAIVLLCSAAGAYITGQTLHIDGGQSI